MRTRRPFDFDGFTLSVSARGNYQEQRESFDPNASVLISNQWDSGDSRFGAMLNVNYASTRWRDQSVTAGAMVPFGTATNPPLGYGAAADNCPNTPPDNPNWIPLERFFPDDCRGTPLGGPLDLIWQPGLDRGLSQEPGATLNIAGVDYEYLLARDAMFAVDAKGNRERPAATLALQFAPNDTSEYTFEAFYQGYREDVFNNLHFTFADWWGGLGPDPGSTITLFPDTNIIKTRTVGFPFGFNSGDSLEQSTDSYVYALNGKWEISDSFTLVGDLSFQDSTFDTNFIAMRTTRVPAQLVVDFNAGDGIPSWHFNDDAEMLDPALWTAAELYPEPWQERGRRGHGAARWRLRVWRYRLLQAAEVRRALRRSRRRRNLRRRQLQPDFLGGSVRALPEGYQYINEGFMDGEADVPTSWMVANGWYIQDHRDDLRALYGQPAGDPALFKAFDVTETTMSAYAMADMDFGDKFHVNAGVRFVKVDTDMTFIDVLNPAEPPVSDRLQCRRLAAVGDAALRRDRRVPAACQLRRDPCAARTSADLNPNFNLTDDLSGVGYGTGTGGNPDLEATKGRNYDLTAEWYFAEDSAIYGTLFKRDIEGLVVPLTRRITIANSPFPDTDDFVITQPVNASDGELEGFELGFQYFPSNLPGILNGLGFVGSYTSLDSSQNIPQTDPEGNIVGQETTEFFQVSDASYNVTLAYENSGVGMRLSYVWREKFLNNNESACLREPHRHLADARRAVSTSSSTGMSPRTSRCHSTP